MTKLSDLAAEITNDPLARGYTAMSDQQVAASLNAVNVAVQSYVSHTTLMKWAAAGRMKKLRNGELSVSDTISSMCSVALALLADGVTTFDTGDAGNLALLDALIAGGVLTSTDKADLMTAGVQQVTRASQIGWDYVGPSDVTNARALP